MKTKRIEIEDAAEPPAYSKEEEDDHYLVRLECPICGYRLADRYYKTDFLLWDVEHPDKEHKKMIPTLVRKCDRCANQIGIKIE